MTRTVNQREVRRRYEERIAMENMKRQEEEEMYLKDTVEEDNAREVPSNSVPFIAGEVAPGEYPNAGEAGESGLHAAFGGVAPQRCGKTHHICSLHFCACNLPSYPMW